MDDTQKQALLSAIRSLLIAVGGVFVASGKLDAEKLNTYVGAAMVVLPFIWGVWEKFSSAKTAKLVTAVAVNAAVQRQAPLDAPISQAEQKAIVADAHATVKAASEQQITASLNNSQIGDKP